LVNARGNITLEEYFSYCGFTASSTEKLEVGKLEMNHVIIIVFCAVVVLLTVIVIVMKWRSYRNSIQAADQQNQLNAPLA